MIFRLTPEKVVIRINRLIDELGEYDLRIKEYEEQARLTARLGLSQLGDDFQLIEWRETWDQIYGSLSDARNGIQKGQVNHREINRMLPSVQVALANFRRVLNETDRLRDAGRAAAQQMFGNKNA
jgi:hypothetical protein